MNSLCRISFFCFSFLAVLSGHSALHAQEPTAEQLNFFEEKIRPVLADHCYKCHSARSKKLKAELYLDSREGLLKGGETGPVVVPGKPEASLLIRAVVYLDNELEMPPNKKLPDKVIADLQEWIRIGAPWPEEKPTQNAAQGGESKDWNKLRLESWAFRPVKKPTPPETKHQELVNNPVDQFVLARIEKRGLEPLGRSGKRSLLRRVYLDLIGLPPTPEEMKAFLDDQRENALGQVIDSLLNSGATIVTFDVYQRYLRPGATERELVTLGRVCIAVFVTGAALLSLLIMDPNREEHFLTLSLIHI